MKESFLERLLVWTAFVVAVGLMAIIAVTAVVLLRPQSDPTILERIDTLYQPCPGGTLTWEHPTADSTGTIKMFVCPNEGER